jgi:hypothetical protein
VAHEPDSDQQTLDQEIEGSNPSSPANPQDTGLNVRLDYYILWFERVQASVAKEAIRCNGHLTLLILGHLTLSVAVRGHQTLTVVGLLDPALDRAVIADE